jgi:hypothetical protein
MYGIIFSQLGRKAHGYFQTRALPKVLTMLGFLGVFIFVMLGLYELLSQGLGFIKDSPFFGNAVSLYLYEMILLVVMCLSIATALIEGTFSLFRNSNELWILSSPGFNRVPTMVLYETIIGGSFLPILILAIPTLSAMEHVYSIGVVGFVLSLLAILLLVAASVTTTLIVELLVARVLKTVRCLRLSILLSVMVVLVTIAGAITWHSVGHEGTELLFPDYSQLSAHSAKIDSVVLHFDLLPSHPTSLALYAAENKDTNSLLEITFGMAVVVFLLCGIFQLTTTWYLSMWQDLQSEPQTIHSKTIGAQAFPRFFKGPTGALFEKEWIVLFRTGRDFMWLLFMLFLWLLQIAIDVLIKREAAGNAIGSFPLVIQALEVGVIAYFLGAFALRFAFPTFSTERGTAWIVNAAPVPLSRIYVSKLVFFTGFFSLLSVAVALLHSYLLGLSALSTTGLVLISVISGVTITALSILLGVAFPNFETTDPQALSTSLPGILLVLIFLIYGALGSYAFLELLKYQSFADILWFTIASLVVSGVCILLSLQKLKTFEFGTFASAQ